MSFYPDVRGLDDRPPFLNLRFLQRAAHRASAAQEIILAGADLWQRVGRLKSLPPMVRELPPDPRNRKCRAKLILLQMGMNRDNVEKASLKRGVPILRRL
jgi:hypothetical protein